MSENEQAAVVICEHYWAWVSPAGARRCARLCMRCHAPDPVWLNHIVEVDLGEACDRPDCVHCEFGEVRFATPTATPQPTHQPPPEQAANESEMRG